MADSTVVNEVTAAPEGAGPPYILMANNPVAILHSKFNNSSAKEKKIFDFKPHRWAISWFLDYLFHEDRCINMYNPKRPLQCTCFQSLVLPDSEKNKVLEYLLDFAQLKRKEQEKIVFEWVKYAFAQIAAGTTLPGTTYKESKARRYLLPGSMFMVCANTCQRMIGWGNRAWQRLQKAGADNQLPVHGLEGKPSNNQISFDARNNMKYFFETMKTHAAPSATRQVRIIAARGNPEKIELRDKDEDVIELPPYYNKNNMFKRFCFDCGWTPVFDNLHRLVDMKALHPEERNELKDMPSYPTFLNYWKTNYPKMVTQRPREDVCEECYSFANHYKSIQARKKRKEERQEEMERAARRERVVLADGEDLLCQPVAEEDEEEETQQTFTLEQEEDLVLTVAKHVEQQKKQRELVIRKRLEARQDKHKPNHDRSFTFVADYSQNCYVPNYADEQPGKTYFLSPLNAYVFGVCDASTDPTKLAAHFYMEPDGAKGGNNVASLLWKELGRHGLIPTRCPSTQRIITRTHRPAKEVNFVFDNCTGQNKNRMVLRLLYFMIRMKVCRVARCLFLVRGHTKNECDRMFNAMKNKYRRINVYTPTDLFEALNTHQDVNAIPVQEGEFRDWATLQDEYMRKIDNVKKNHIFEVNDLDPNTMWVQETDGDVRKAQKLVKPEHIDNNEWFLQKPQPLKIPGIKYLTWKELFDKWKPVVPPDKWSQWKYFSEDLPKTKRTAIKDNTKASKTTRKARERASNEAQEPPKKKQKKNSNKPKKTNKKK